MDCDIAELTWVSIEKQTEQTDDLDLEDFEEEKAGTEDANLWFSAHQVLFTIIKISVRQSWVKTEKVGRPREISRFCNIYMGYSGGFEAAVRSAKFSRCPPPHGVCKYQLIFLLEVSILIFFLRISISDFGWLLPMIEYLSSK